MIGLNYEFYRIGHSNFDSLKYLVYMSSFYTKRNQTTDESEIQEVNPPITVAASTASTTE